LYINDIADNTQSFSRLFADDNARHGQMPWICHKTLNKLFHDFPKPSKYYGKFLLIDALWNVYA
jgi:hypothetical protein